VAKLTVSLLDVLQASEDGVHFIVSRQICLPASDVLQEAPWGADGPPPYSPVDMEQTLLVSAAGRRVHPSSAVDPPSKPGVFLRGTRPADNTLRTQNKQNMNCD